MSTLRVLLRRVSARPSFTIVSVLTLAIGIGANLAIFTIVNALLLRPLPTPDSDQLVILNHSAPGLVQLGELPISDALYFLYTNESGTLGGVALFDDGRASFTGPDNPQRVVSATVTASFFDVVRTPPRLGRAFTAASERDDAEPVVVVSDALWKSRFGADPTVVGQRVEIDGERVEIVGVMPPGFAFPEPETELWRPAQLDPDRTQLGSFGFRALGRIGDGSTIEQVRAELTGMTSNLAELFPDQPATPVLVNAGFTARVISAREFIVGDIEATLWILLGAVGVLLLIACANVANLFLARAEARHRELAIRVALGESRTQVVGSTLVESVTLGVLGGIAALPLALAAVQLLVRFGPQELPRLSEISLDGTVLGFGVALSLVAGLVFGIVPALRASSIPASDSLTEATRGASAGRERHLTRRTLVVAQIGLALTLLVGSGLAVRSFQRLASVDPGFDPTGVLSFRLALPEQTYEAADSRLSFHRRLVEQFGGLPGAAAAAAVSNVPLGGSLSGSGHSLEGQPLTEGEVPPVFMMKQVSPGYFDVMRVALVEGRDFDALDEERGAPVVIVTRALARKYWPDESALGKGIRRGGRPGDGQDWFRIVGVVDDVHEISLHNEPLELVYYPLTVETDAGREVPLAMSYVIRAEATGRRVKPILS